MKAKAILVINSKIVEDVEKHNQDLGLKADIPEFEYGEFDLLFNIIDVKFAYISPRKHIMLMVIDEWFEVKFDQSIWDKLTTKFDEPKIQNTFRDSRKPRF